MTDCHLGILTKQDYEDTLAQIQNQLLEHKVDFIRSCPPFHQITQKLLLKLHFYFRPKVFYRDQVVIKQGCSCEHVYLVISGEFEQCVTVEQQLSKNLHEMNLNGPQKVSETHMKRIIRHKPAKKKMIVNTSLLNKGMMIGIYDAVQLRAYTSTVRCRTQIAEAYEISATDYFHLIRLFDCTVKEVEENALRIQDKNKE